MQFSPYTSLIPLVLRYKFHPQILTSSPERGHQTMMGWGNKLFSNFMHQQAVVPRSGPLQFDFEKGWTTQYAACSITSNAVNSTGLGHSLPWLQRASQLTNRCRIVGLHAG